MKKRLLYVLLIGLGVVMFVYAGYDDSPGGQLLGVLTAMYGVMRLINKP